MKILKVGVSLPVVGGAETYTFELCRELSKRGIDVILLTQRDRRTKTNFRIIEVPCLKRNVYLRNITFYIFSIPYLIKSIVLDKPSIVHINFNIISGLLGLISKIFGVKTVYTIHGFSGWRMSRSLVLKFLVKSYLNYSDLIICVSPSIIDDLKKIGVNRRLVYIPNAIDEKYFSFRRKKPQKYILFFGRLHKQKGVEYLIKAYRAIYDKVEGYKLIIIGDGPEKKNLLLLAKDVKNIIFTGYLEEEKLVKFIMSAYVIVLPSIYEGFPISLIKAMSSGRPVITTNIKEIKSVIKKGVIFVRPKNTLELEKEIYKLIKYPNLAEKIGKEGREIAKRFVWTKVSREYINTYKKILGQK